MATATAQLPRLHAVTDDRVVALPDLTERAAAMARAVRGGLAVHVRSRALEAGALLELARRMNEAIAGTDAWLVVNGRADIAAAVEAQAVVSGTGGLAVADLRRVAPNAKIGRSVHDAAGARAAADEGADFLIAGSVYATASHPDRAPQGLGLVTAAAATGKPVIGIGGIGAAQVADVVQAGAWGVAAIRALWDAPDPAAAAASFLTACPPDRPTAVVDVVVNGEPRRISAGASLADLLGTLGLDQRAVVVEHNRHIVRREGLAAARIGAGDQIELVHFVGGG